MSKRIESNISIPVKSIPLGSSINVEHISSLGKDAKEIRDTLRCLYSKKVRLQLNGLVFNLEEGLAVYRTVLELLSYIIERQSINVKAGIDAARKNGKQIGRKKISLEDLPEVFINSYDSYKQGNITKVDFSKMCSCSRPALDRWIRCYEQEIKK